MDIITAVVNEITDTVSVEKIFLISKKLDVAGQLQSFKLCVIINAESVSQAEEKLYMQIDCDISFDLVLYKTDEWDKLVNDIGSFAWKIFSSGSLLYDTNTTENAGGVANE
ncbi:hypothetical protein FACS1894132_14900 [Clostridia bacterium]|nr:hypothetical protein FACS1894132_14900 [Clostridia bacterium]